MTEEEIRSAPAEELRVLVAEARGWRLGPVPAGYEPYWIRPDGGYTIQGMLPDWPYDIVGAMELTTDFDGFTLDRADDRGPGRRWHCDLRKMSIGAWSAFADTEAVAIIRAVLLAGLEE